MRGFSPTKGMLGSHRGARSGERIQAAVSEAERTQALWLVGNEQTPTQKPKRPHRVRREGLTFRERSWTVIRSEIISQLIDLKDFSYKLFRIKILPEFEPIPPSQVSETMEFTRSVEKNWVCQKK